MYENALKKLVQYLANSCTTAVDGLLIVLVKIAE